MLTIFNQHGVSVGSVSDHHGSFEIGEIPSDITPNDLERWGRNVGIAGDVVPRNTFGHVSKDTQYAAIWLREQLCETHQLVVIQSLQLQLLTTSTSATAWAVSSAIVARLRA